MALKIIVSKFRSPIFHKHSSIIQRPSLVRYLLNQYRTTGNLKLCYNLVPLPPDNYSMRSFPVNTIKWPQFAPFVCLNCKFFFQEQQHTSDAQTDTAKQNEPPKQWTADVWLCPSSVSTTELCTGRGWSATFEPVQVVWWSAADHCHYSSSDRPADDAYDLPKLSCGDQHSHQIFTGPYRLCQWPNHCHVGVGSNVFNSYLSPDPFYDHQHCICRQLIIIGRDRQSFKA